jgi:hypothetical protein
MPARIPSRTPTPDEEGPTTHAEFYALGIPPPFPQHLSAHEQALVSACLSAMFCHLMRQAGYTWSLPNLGNHDLTALHGSFHLFSWFPAKLEQVKKLDQALQHHFGTDIGHRLWEGHWNGQFDGIYGIQVWNGPAQVVLSADALRIFRVALVFYGLASYRRRDHRGPLNLVRSCM